ncbi:MAG: hypothetical protein NTX51_19635 [Verrucomicrobia bacterium]|nr:hypothetical protein [Verrucomicrobiota bacterium]
MRNRLSSLSICLLLAALSMATVWTSSVQAAGKPRNRSINFSEPKSDEVTTNLHQLSAKKDSLKQFEEDLYRSMQTFSGKDSMEAVPLPPRMQGGSVIPSKRAKEQLDRHKNAIFLKPEDLVPAPTAEQIFKIPEYGADGVEKKRKTPIEIYYDRMDAKHAGALKPSRSLDDESSDTSSLTGRRDVFTSRGDPDLPPGLREREQDVKKLMEADGSDNPSSFTSSRRGSFSDIFGLGDTAPSREKALEHKKVMEEFYGIHDSNRPLSAGAEGPKSPGLPDAPRRVANPFGGLDTSSGESKQFSAINPIFTPGGPKDVNVQPLGQPGASYLLPKAEPLKAPVAPTFAAPRRPF